MEKQERNLAIETIVKIVNNKYPNYQSQPNIIRGKCEYQINTKKNNCCLNLFNKAYEIPLELNTIKFINKSQSENISLII